MNYGKFFRLNQKTSKIEDGIAIYDYIDLPAYFEDSDSNEMSPKYPISVAITENSVRFRVHYSVFKAKCNEEGYSYNVEEAFSINRCPFWCPTYDPSSDLKHIEEVLLGLPYTNDSTDILYNRINDIYSTKYPYSVSGTTLLHQLIENRYSDKKHYKKDYTPNNNELEKTLYENLRNSQDEATSYSTLWLMDIKKEHANVNLYNKNGDIIRFLRKLLLDFMFDLKHSDVFQTSIYYQAMYSGLMSNFYFSALMHKCEYYFYREQIEKILEDFKDKDGNNIQSLYADELFNAETLWIRDIMNPLAENYFEHTFYKGNNDNTEKSSTLLSKLNERYKYRSWDSWFASPEEEMRRVCFTMKEEGENTDENINKEGGNKKKRYIYHICNTETIAEYLQLGKKSDSLSKRMMAEMNNNKTAISQWFLKKYAFRDVLHLHLYEHAFMPFFLTILIGLGFLFYLPEFFTKFSCDCNYIGFKLFFIYILCILLGDITYMLYKKNTYQDTLSKKRSDLIFKRTTAFLFTIVLTIAISYAISLTPQYWNTTTKMLSGVSSSILIILQITLIIIVGLIINKMIHPLHWLSNMHVFFPRLIAAITAAWLSLAIGNELFGHFFDSTVSWSTSIWLTLIVFIFVMYELNKMLPFETRLNKSIRCLEIIAISYVISLIVGLFIINFMGERLLERSDAISDFYSQYVDKNAPKQVEDNQYYFRCEDIRENNTKDNTKYLSHFIIKGVANNIDSINHQVSLMGDIKGNVSVSKSNQKEITNADLLNYLDKTYIVQPCDKTSSKYPKNHPIATKLKFGNTEFFILRDFLIQFAFIAMFIGIFIQMLFEEKSLT